MSTKNFVPKPVKLTHLSGTAADKKYCLPKNRDLFGCRSIVLNHGDAKHRMEEIRVYFHNTFEIMEKVFECLAGEESFTVQPLHKLRHPMIFYYGHTACFYINKLVVGGLTERINPRFEEIFAIGVDEMSWDDLNNDNFIWPSVAEVSAYRLQVRNRIDELIISGKFQLKMPLTFAESTVTNDNAFWWILMMGIEHERIHLETASVHVRELPLNYVNTKMSAFWSRCEEQSDAAPANSMVEIDAGDVSIGRRNESALYGWDCDYAEGVKINVKPFKASKYLVSNAEFFEFVKVGGYREPKYWDEEGWAWVSWKKPEHPCFWVKDETNEWGYKLRLQMELINVPWDWPVEVNHLEATAFVRFKSDKEKKNLRLLTEAEWLLLHDRYIMKDHHEWEVAPGNVNLEHYRSSCPVNKYPQGPLYDIVGNVWQHTVNPVYPYKGYTVQPFYDDFSSPTFDGRHFCMKGGAWISTGNESSRDSRFAFRRHFHQFIGIRYVEQSSDSTLELTPGKAPNVAIDPEVEKTTHFAFYDDVCGIRNINLVIADYAKEVFMEHGRSGGPNRALDLYCGAGRVTFELTTMFKEVIGSDFTARKLVPSYAIRERGETYYNVPVGSEAGGELTRFTVNRSGYPWAKTYERALFFQSDPSNLHAHMTNFDLIIAFNVLENHYQPEAIPAHLVGRLNPGGILIVASTFDWQHIKKKYTQYKESILPPLLRRGADHVLEIEKLIGSHVSRIMEPRKYLALYPDSTTSGKVQTLIVTAYRKDC
eukprot:Tbor_TRINITY_DN4340_c0_g1::TRINITY_DN4340_c0_g1_i1::g.7774::m.7774